MRKARDSGIDVDAIVAAAPTASFTFTHATELTLLSGAMHVSSVITTIEDDLMPHHLSEFLFGFSQAAAAFHRDCNVLSTATPPLVRDSRLRIVSVALAIMATAMRLLGLTPLERL